MYVYLYTVVNNSLILVKFYNFDIITKPRNSNVQGCPMAHEYKVCDPQINGNMFEIFVISAKPVLVLSFQSNCFLT